MQENNIFRATVGMQPLAEGDSVTQISTADIDVITAASGVVTLAMKADTGLAYAASILAANGVLYGWTLDGTTPNNHEELSLITAIDAAAKTITMTNSTIDAEATDADTTLTVFQELDIPIGYQPGYVQVRNETNGSIISWDSGAADGSHFVSGTGKVTTTGISKILSTNALQKVAGISLGVRIPNVTDTIGEELVIDFDRSSYTEVDISG